MKSALMVNYFCFINAIILYSRLFCCTLLPSAYWTASGVCSMKNIIALAKYALLLFVNMKKKFLSGHCISVVSFRSEYFNFVELLFNTIQVGKRYLVS